MKKAVTICILVFFAFDLQSQPSLSKAQKAAQQTIIEFFNAISNRDSVSLKDISTADVTLYEYGQIWNIDTLITKVIVNNKATDFKRTNSFDFIETRTDKNQAFLSYRLYSTILKEGKKSNIHWLETVVLVKKQKNWKVKHLHSTLIKRN